MERPGEASEYISRGDRNDSKGRSAEEKYGMRCNTKIFPFAAFAASAAFAARNEQGRSSRPQCMQRPWDIRRPEHTRSCSLQGSQGMSVPMNVHQTRVHEEYRGRRVCSDQPSPFMGNKGERLRSIGEKCCGSPRNKMQDTRKQQEPRSNEEIRSTSNPSHAELLSAVCLAGVSASIRGHVYRSRNEFGMTMQARCDKHGSTQKTWEPS